MSAITLRQKLQSQTLLGVCNNYPAAGIIESMAKGWDLLWIDGQHGQMHYDATLSALRTADSMALETLLRVPGHDPDLIALYADTAPSALMIPMVNTPAQAQAIIAAANFPPTGTRSYGGRRPIDLFGRTFYQSQNPLLVLQIETVEAVESADAIAALPGTDMLFFGADDLKLSLGLPIDAPVTPGSKLYAAMEKTAHAAKVHHKFLGCVAAVPDTVKIAVALGYHLLIAGADSAFLRAASTEKLNTLRPLTILP